MASEPQKGIHNINVKFVPELSDSSQEVYANVIQVSHTPWDFTLLFCCATMPDESKVNKLKKRSLIEVPAPSVASIKISPRMAKEVVDILQMQIEKYNENFVESEG